MRRTILIIAVILLSACVGEDGHPTEYTCFDDANCPSMTHCRGGDLLAPTVGVCWTWHWGTDSGAKSSGPWGVHHIAPALQLARAAVAPRTPPRVQLLEKVSRSGCAWR